LWEVIKDYTLGNNYLRGEIEINQKKGEILLRKKNNTKKIEFVNSN